VKQYFTVECWSQAGSSVRCMMYWCDSVFCWCWQSLVGVHGWTETTDDLSLWTGQLHRCTRHARCFCSQLHSKRLQSVTPLFYMLCYVNWYKPIEM